MNKNLLPLAVLACCGLLLTGCGDAAPGGGKSAAGSAPDASTSATAATDVQPPQAYGPLLEALQFIDEAEYESAKEANEELAEFGSSAQVQLLGDENWPLCVFDATAALVVDPVDETAETFRLAAARGVSCQEAIAAPEVDLAVLSPVDAEVLFTEVISVVSQGPETDAMVNWVESLAAQEAVRAAEELAADSARDLALQLEASASANGGILPKTEIEMRDLVATEPGGPLDHLVSYTYVPPTPTSPAGFELCASANGNYAKYESLRGGLTERGEGETCPA